MKMEVVKLLRKDFSFGALIREIFGNFRQRKSLICERIAGRRARQMENCEVREWGWCRTGKIKSWANAV